MRKIVVIEFMTLDGVIQAPGGPKEDTAGGFKYGGWSFPLGDALIGKVMGKQMSGTYDLLLGRKTYDIFAAYWPHHGDVWPQVNRITKYVVSRTLKHPSWAHTVVINRNVVGELKKLRKGKGPPLHVFGSGNLVQTLLQHDLVDELWLKIYPIVLGVGKRLFAHGVKPAGFRLFESRTSSKGVIVASYKRGGVVRTGSF